MPPRKTKAGVKRKREAVGATAAATALPGVPDGGVNASALSGYNDMFQTEAKKLLSRLFGLTATAAKALLRSPGTDASAAAPDAAAAAAAVAAGAAGAASASPFDGDAMYADLLARRAAPHRYRVFADAVDESKTDALTLQCAVHALVRHGLWRNQRVATTIVGALRDQMPAIPVALAAIPIADARYDPHGSYTHCELLPGGGHEPVLNPRSLVWRACAPVIDPRVVAHLLARGAERAPGPYRGPDARRLEEYIAPRDHLERSTKRLVEHVFAFERDGYGDTWQHAWDRECGTAYDADAHPYELWGSPLHVLLDRLMYRWQRIGLGALGELVPADLHPLMQNLHPLMCCTEAIIALLQRARAEDNGDAPELTAPTVRLDTPRGHSAPNGGPASFLFGSAPPGMRGTVRQRLHRWLSQTTAWEAVLTSERLHNEGLEDPHTHDMYADVRNEYGDGLSLMRRVIVAVNDVAARREAHRKAAFAELLRLHESAAAGRSILGGIPALLALVAEYAFAPQPEIAKYPLPTLAPLPIRVHGGVRRPAAAAAAFV